MTISLIVAVSENLVIGKDGDLPWHLPADLRHFKNTTMGHHLIIGRRTWDEVGGPLPGRKMVVITRSRTFSAEGATVVHSLEEALEAAADDSEPFIGGGAYIYRMALARDLVDRLYITRIHAEVEGDTFFPEVDFEDWNLLSEEHHEADEKNEHPYSFLVYERPAGQESQAGQSQE
jgi:dihydrofolate reductase